MDRETRIAALRELGPLEPVSEEWETWEEYRQGHPHNPNMPLLGLLGWREEPGMDGDDFREGERARGQGHLPFDASKGRSWKLGWLEEDAAQQLRQERAGQCAGVRSRYNDTLTPAELEEELQLAVEAQTDTLTPDQLFPQKPSVTPQDDAE